MPTSWYLQPQWGQCLEVSLKSKDFCCVPLSLCVSACVSVYTSGMHIYMHQHLCGCKCTCVYACLCESLHVRVHDAHIMQGLIRLLFHWIHWKAVSRSNSKYTSMTSHTSHLALQTSCLYLPGLKLYVGHKPYSLFTWGSKFRCSHLNCK